MDPPAIEAVLLGSAVVSALVTAVLGHWNELARAREERRQKRLGETYLQVIEMVLVAADWAERTEPFMSMAGQPGPSEFPTDEQQRVLRARLSAYGSPVMQKTFHDVISSFVTFSLAVTTYQLMKNNPPRRASAGDELHKAHMAIFDIREKQVRPASFALLELANAELGERQLGHLARLAARVGRAVPRPDLWVRARVRRATPSPDTEAAQ